jgi:hypothetical protein
VNVSSSWYQFPGSLKSTVLQKSQSGVGPLANDSMVNPFQNFMSVLAESFETIGSTKILEEALAKKAELVEMSS